MSELELADLQDQLLTLVQELKETAAQLQNPEIQRAYLDQLMRECESLQQQMERLVESIHIALSFYELVEKIQEIQPPRTPHTKTLSCKLRSARDCLKEASGELKNARSSLAT